MLRGRPAGRPPCFLFREQVLRLVDEVACSLVFSVVFFALCSSHEMCCYLPACLLSSLLPPDVSTDSLFLRGYRPSVACVCLLCCCACPLQQRCYACNRWRADGLCTFRALKMFSLLSLSPCGLSLGRKQTVSQVSAAGRPSSAHAPALTMSKGIDLTGKVSNTSVCLCYPSLATPSPQMTVLDS